MQQEARIQTQQTKIKETTEKQNTDMTDKTETQTQQKVE